MVSGMMVVSQPLTFAIIRIETFIIIKVLLLKYQMYKNNNKSQLKLEIFSQIWWGGGSGEVGMVPKFNQL